VFVFFVQTSPAELGTSSSVGFFYVSLVGSLVGLLRFHGVACHMCYQAALCYSYQVADLGWHIEGLDKYITTNTGNFPH
jgi:hypothetical protein